MREGGAYSDNNFEQSSDEVSISNNCDIAEAFDFNFCLNAPNDCAMNGEGAVSPTNMGKQLPSDEHGDNKVPREQGSGQHLQ